MRHCHRRCGRIAAAALGVAVATVVIQPGAYAGTVTWVGPGSGTWSNAGNWSSNPALPGAGDDVVITLPGGTVTVGGDQSVHSVASTGNLLVNDVALRLAGDSVIGGRFDVAAPQPWFWAPTIQSAGNLELNGGGSWTGGTFTGPGVTTITAGTTFTASPQGNLHLDGGHTLQNAGTLNYDLTIGGHAWDLTSGTLVNLAGGTFNVLTGPETLSGGTLSGPGTFSNAGTLNKLGGRAWEVRAPFNNTGTLNVTGGTLTLTGGGTLAGEINVAPPATANFNSGTYVIDPAATFTGTGKIRVADGAIFQFYADNTVDDNFEWNGGTLIGAGKTVVPAGVTFAITPVYQSGSTTPVLAGRTLENAGTVNLTATNAPSWANNMTLRDGAVINNLAGATFNLSDAGIWWGGSSPVGTAFNNAGTVNVGGTSGLLSVTFNNAGSVTVAPGARLTLSGGGTESGTFSLGTGATLEFAGGSTTLAPSASISGGTMQVSGGTVFVPDPAVIAGMPLTIGGSQYDKGTLSVTGDNTVDQLTWSTGTLAGTGKTTIPAGAVATITPSNNSAPALDHRVLENAGTINLGLTGSYNGLRLTNGAAINNLAGGTFNLSDDGRVWSDAGTVFNNAGTVNAGGTTSELGVTFNNTGTLNVTSGTLSLTGGGTQTGVINIAASATADFNRGTFVIDPAATFTGTGKFRLSNSATLQFNADNTMGNNFEWIGGTLTGAGRTVVPAGITVAVTPIYQSGGTTPVLAGRTLENAGTINLGTADWQNSLSLRDGAAVNNLAGATFNISNAGVGWGGLTPTGTAFNNAGTINAGGTTSAMGVPFNNTGTLNITSGTLSLTGGGTQSGAINVASSATADFNSGTFVIDPAATFTGTGKIRLSNNATLQFGTDSTAGDNFEWNGGTLTGAGKTTVPTGAILAITPVYESYSVGPVLSGRRLENAGTVNLGVVGRQNGLSLRDGAVINNLVGATFNFSDAHLLSGSTSDTGTALDNAGTVNADGTKSYLGVTFDNTGTLNVRQGTLNVTGMVTQLAGSTLTGGTWNVAANATLAISTGSDVTTIGPAAEVALDGPGASFAKVNALANVQGSFTITGGRSFTTVGGLTNSGELAVGTGSTLKVAGDLVSSGTITNDGTIDLVGNRMVLDYASDSLADWLRGQLLSGRNGGAWVGAAGVLSSAAAGDAQRRMGIGYAEASLLGVGLWGNTGVDRTAVVAELAYYGDANLDGVVGADDFVLLDRGFARGVADAHWTDGDFNYDGVVDQNDYLLADRVFVEQGGAMSPDFLARREAQFGPAYVAALVTSVPEPSVSVAGLILVGAAVQRRRRREA